MFSYRCASVHSKGTYSIGFCRRFLGRGEHVSSVSEPLSCQRTKATGKPLPTTKPIIAYSSRLLHSKWEAGEKTEENVPRIPKVPSIPGVSRRRISWLGRRPFLLALGRWHRARPSPAPLRIGSAFLGFSRREPVQLQAERPRI